MKEEINIIPLFCESFSTNPKIYKLIDELYKKDSLLFYQTAKSSPWYTHPIALEGSIEQEEYFKKALGIFLNIDQYSEDILKIIKKGWNYAYTYSETHSTFTLDDFLNSFVKKKKGTDNIHDDEFNSNINMLLALAGDKIDINTTLYTEYAGSIITRLNHYNKNNPHRFGLNNASKEVLKKIKEIKLRLKQDFGDMRSINNFSLENTDLKYYSIAQDFIYDCERLSLVSISNSIVLSEKDLDEIIYSWICCFNDDSDILAIGKYVLSMVHIKYFCKVYRKAKEYHFNNNKETMFLEMDLLEKKSEKLTVDNAKLSNTNAELLKRINQLEKENALLKIEAEKNDDMKAELNALREFAFNQDKRLDANNEDIDISKINNVKGLILGGSNNWQHKMKELLPNYKFISVEALNFDKRILDDVDIIFIYTNYLNHALYYKLMGLSKNKKIVYLNSNINQELVLKQMYDELKFR